MPERLSGRPLSEIQRMPLVEDGPSLSIGEVFLIRGTADDTLIFDGDCSAVERLGAGLQRGMIQVAGSVGPCAGWRMTGGVLRIGAHAAAGLGQAMRGGRIELAGHAGDDVGGPDFGSPRGMSGGEILIAGSAGNRVGRRMRRGLIAIGGDLGDDLADEMLAGTIVVGGSLGSRPGVGLRRGSLVALGGRADLPLTYRYACRCQPAWVRVALRYLAGLGHAIGPEFADAHFHLHRGDLLTGGRGECLVADE